VVPNLRFVSTSVPTQPNGAEQARGERHGHP
jgi:hypothetical protein